MPYAVGWDGDEVQKTRCEVVDQVSSRISRTRSSRKYIKGRVGDHTVMGKALGRRACAAHFEAG
jgi:hypothetical protein